jgi:hypothetical protein
MRTPESSGSDLPQDRAGSTDSQSDLIAALDGLSQALARLHRDDLSNVERAALRSLLAELSKLDTQH